MRSKRLIIGAFPRFELPPCAGTILASAGNVVLAALPLLFLVVLAALLGLALGPLLLFPSSAALLTALLLLLGSSRVPARVVPVLLTAAALLVGVARSSSMKSPELPRLDEDVLAELCLQESSLDGGEQMLGGRAVALFSATPHSGQPEVIWSGGLSVSLWARWSAAGDGVARSGDCWLFRVRLREPAGISEKHLFFARGRGLLITRSDAFPVRLQSLLHGRVRVLRAVVASGLKRLAPTDQLPLFMALVLGDRSLLDDNHREAFVRTGTAHLLAISGLHVGMVALWLFGAAHLVLDRVLVRVCRPLVAAGHGRRIAQVFALSGATSYVLMAGSPVSARRALLMLGSMVLAVWLGRPAAAGNGLLLAALAIVWLDPPTLFDTSLHLSVAAVASLLLLSRALRGFRCLVHCWWGGLLLLVASSAVAAVGTAPVCLWTFGRASIAGLWVNPLVVPLLGSMTLPPLLAGAIAAPVCPSLGAMLLTLASWPAGLGTWLVEAAAQPRWCPELIGSISGAEVVALYLTAALIAAFFVWRADR